MTSNFVTTARSARQLRQTGRLAQARWSPSPNCGKRPEGADVSLLVVHNISLPPGHFGGDYIEQFFLNTLDNTAHPYFATLADLAVSAHALIRRDGSVIQFVSFLDRAWHAGRSQFCGQEECNDFSIGIELEGADNVPYEVAQYEALANIALLVMRAWPQVTPERIAGHCDIAPGRKTDPGASFDWAYFRNQLQRMIAGRQV